MNGLKHTPGPWEYRAGFICTKEEDPIVLSGIPRWHKKHTRINDSPFAGYQDGYFWPSKDEIEANARLIAAAPELLEALIALTEFAKANGYDSNLLPEMKNARAAIAKATTK